MWILVRIIISIIAFFLRSKKWFNAAPTPESYNAGNYDLRTNKHGSTVTVALPSGIYFRVSRENWFDRLFKKLGLSAEFQVGISDFDEKIYLACDHPFFAGSLRQNEKSRSLILKLVHEMKFTLLSDGTNLMAKKPAKVDEIEISKILLDLANEFKMMSQSLSSRWSDKLAFRISFVESVVFSIAAFAISSVLDNSLHSYDYHLNIGKLYLKGSFVAAMAFVIILASIIALLKKSSRTQVVIFEAFVVLVLSLPVAGVQVISDLNRGLDRESVVGLTGTLQDKKITYTRSKNGRTPHYHLFVLMDQASSAAGLELPVIKAGKNNVVRFTVDFSIYNSIQPGQSLDLEAGRGFLEIPWIKSINGYPVGDPTLID